MPLQDIELVSQSQDLDALVPVAAGERPWCGERICYGEIGETDQRNQSSSSRFAHDTPEASNLAPSRSR
jgi:hypothetical protein